MNPDIKKIIHYATFSPSGENCQPWKFIVKGNNVKLFNLPERDQSLYSWGQRASYIANGAALENISIASSNLGFECRIKLFPDTNNTDLIANIDFTKKDENPDLLFQYIPNRSTNRKPYENKLVPESDIKILEKSINSEDCSIFITQDTNKKNILGKAGAVNEEIMLDNEYLHKFFFNHISWTKEQDTKNKIGFFIDTLELPPPAKIGFKLFSNWSRAKILNKFGMYKMIGKQNAQINSSSSGFGIITIKDKSPEEFVKLGRSVQRMWLTATKLGISIQPLTGVIFFMYKIQANEIEKFSLRQIEMIKQAYASILNSFNISGNEPIAFMFRFGYGGNPTARSSKFPVEEIIEIIN